MGLDGFRHVHISEEFQPLFRCSVPDSQTNGRRPGCLQQVDVTEAASGEAPCAFRLKHLMASKCACRSTWLLLAGRGPGV